jgi:hypothetical protein
VNFTSVSFSKKEIASGTVSRKSLTPASLNVSGARFLRYVSASSRVSPCATPCPLPGTQAQPAERAVVPPKYCSFSATITVNPCEADFNAAAIPATPEPMTRTSQTVSRLVPALLMVPVLLIWFLLFSVGCPHPRGSRVEG